MKRREFIRALGGAAVAWPSDGWGQQQLDQMKRLGVLTTLPESDPEGKARFAALRKGLQEFGWSEGRNLQIDFRWSAANPERLRAAAAELLALKPDVVFCAPTSTLAAMQRETRSVPIVFAQVADPVGTGFVTSLARPGGNITGFATLEFAAGAKWLELVRELAPSVERVVAIFDPANPGSTGYLPMIDAAARSSGKIQVSSQPVRDIDEIERSIASFALLPNGALILIPGPLTVAHRELIVSLANRHRLPNVAGYRFYPVSGGLASYGADNIDLYRRAASYVDRILKGEKPAELPVQMASKFELVINLKSAKTLGLTVPPTLLARADEVIE